MVDNNNVFIRHWLRVIILGLIAGLVLFILLNLGQVINITKEKLVAFKLIDQKNRESILYKGDKFGGDSPEETFDLFISALEQENVDLAANYFTITQRTGWKKVLGQYKERNILTNFISEVAKIRKNWKKEEGVSSEDYSKFRYPTADANYPSAESAVIFQRFNGRWRIRSM